MLNDGCSGLWAAAVLAGAHCHGVKAGGPGWGEGVVHRSVEKRLFRNAHGKQAGMERKMCGRGTCWNVQ